MTRHISASLEFVPSPFTDDPTTLNPQSNKQIEGLVNVKYMIL